MGIGLRGNTRQSSNGTEQNEATASQRKVSDKRNNLKNMVVGELSAGFKKPGSVISSQISSQESNDQVMSLRGFGRAGSDDGLSTGN
jgi:hypothetical protein